MCSLSSSSYDLLFGGGVPRPGNHSGDVRQILLSSLGEELSRGHGGGSVPGRPTGSCFSLALTPPPASQPAPTLPEGTPPNPASPRRPVSTLDHRTAS